MSMICPAIRKERILISGFPWRLPRVQIGSIFEYANQRPVFGVVSSDSALYAPLLGFFVFTGIPTSGFLWFKAVQTANKEAEEQDRRDGFL
ncbi:hypothetical protein E2562_006321 [Oryza meyeriana var. granulata]|uniref:Uncharacterized protein n=1 Tax=Oryza meyeriana var. granulata TaxID=110450 RepID=A0A6G1EF84_9ORYZ|nr:hypothetical protein E2562_006321 [Oryza meyeriana var. granulata]